MKVMARAAAADRGRVIRFVSSLPMTATHFESAAVHHAETDSDACQPAAPHCMAQRRAGRQQTSMARLLGRSTSCTPG